MVGWEHDLVENIVLCQPQELFSDLNLLCSGHLGGEPNVADVTIYSDPLPGLNYNSWTYNSTLEGNKQKEETNRRSNPLTKRHVKCTEREMFPNVYCHPPKCAECSKRREPFESLNVHWMTLIVQYSA